MFNNKNKIYIVQKNSIAEEAGIEEGDLLLSINKQNIKDIFDYRYFQASEELILEIEKPDGEIWEIEVEKDESEDLGIEFEDSLIDGAKSCTNKCIFCFIDQLPKGMRETVYFKDDDSRLSFLTGNYVTLTNIKKEELQRIINYRMSPINVSVHTTNPELRKFMLGNRFAGDVLEKIKMLTDSGIEVNCQIVLCRDINDKHELDRTIGDLAQLYPAVNSVSIVPVGISKYRENLYKLIPFDKESCIDIINQVHKLQNELLREKGSRVIYLSDEFYINAEMDIPNQKCYEGFPQIENGVGMLALFINEATVALKSKDNLKLAQKWKSMKSSCNDTLQGCDKKELNVQSKRQISVATGRLVYKNILKLVSEISKVFEGIDVNVYDIENNFFGQHVNVCGLLTGRDIVEQLKDKQLGQELLISRCMLRAGEHVLLDDYTVEQIEAELHVKIRIVENDGADFVSAIIGKF
jgi:putative radical SAM enzyme (TIGR03279 family)